MALRPSDSSTLLLWYLVLKSVNFVARSSAAAKCSCAPRIFANLVCSTPVRDGMTIDLIISTMTSKGLQSFSRSLRSIRTCPSGVKDPLTVKYSPQKAVIPLPTESTAMPGTTILEVNGNRGCNAGEPHTRIQSFIPRDCNRSDIFPPRYDVVHLM